MGRTRGHANLLATTEQSSIVGPTASMMLSSQLTISAISVAGALVAAGAAARAARGLHTSMATPSCNNANRPDGLAITCRHVTGGGSLVTWQVAAWVGQPSLRTVSHNDNLPLPAITVDPLGDYSCCVFVKGGAASATPKKKVHR